MGHDIYAFIFDEHGERLDVAYMRRAAWERTNMAIYALLRCESFYGGVSGDGSHALFTKAVLRKAWRKARLMPFLDREQEFLGQCVKYSGEHDLVGLYIEFG